MRPPAFAAILGMTAVLAAGACTGAAPGPTPTRPGSPTPPAAGAPGAGPSGAAPATPAAPAPPQMTPVDRLECSTTTVRGPGSGPLRVQGRWAPDPGALPDETVTVTRGPDADACTGELPPEPDCAQAIPWTGLSVDALVHASGVQRWVSSSVPGPDSGRPGVTPDPERAARTLTYTVMTPPPGGRLAIGPALVAGASACANTTATTAAGVTLLRGTVVDRWAPATGGAPRTAGLVVVVGPDGAGWALLGGPAWQERDVDAAAAALEAAIARSAAPSSGASSGASSGRSAG